MTCDFTRADPLYRAAVRTANREHPAFTVGNPRPLGWEDLIVALPRLLIVAACCCPVILFAIMIGAVHHG